MENSDDLLVLQVTNTSAGKTTWRPEKYNKGLHLRIMAAGGARVFDLNLPEARFVCTADGLNCKR